MALWKVTLMLQHTSNVANPNSPIHRIGGWSESWYSTAGTLQALLQSLGVVVPPPNPGGGGMWQGAGLATFRAGLLPQGASIVGFRVQSLNPLAQAQSYPANLPGNTNWPADVPQMALLCKAPALGANNIRRFVLRAIPDQFVIQGEFSPDNSFLTALNQFFASLINWQFRGRDLSQATIRIVNITAGVATTVTCEGAFAPTVNAFVRVLKTRDSGGTLRGGRYQVLSVGPGNNVFTIGQWPWGSTTGGSVRSDATVYVNIDAANTGVSRAITRRVGRPFVQYRGRRSRRR